MSDTDAEIDRILDMYALDIADGELEFPDEMKADKETAKEALQALLLRELEAISKAGYDDMLGTYDYNRIVGALDERIAELSRLSGEDEK